MSEIANAHPIQRLRGTKAVSSGLVSSICECVINKEWASSEKIDIKTLTYLPRSGKVLYRFQIKDDIEAARIEATKAYSQYVEEQKDEPTKIAS
jgi:hypothetical protein